MYRSLLLLCSIFLWGCQEVIDVELPVEEPRLAIDALIRITEDLPDDEIHIGVRASLSSSFFDSVQPAQLQHISLTNVDAHLKIDLIEEPQGSGIYGGTWPLAHLTEGELELRIAHGDDIYLARTQFVPGVPIDSIKQGTSQLFGEDETEVLVSFTDNGDRKDFYLFDFNFGEFLVTDDEFYPGQSFEFSFFYDRELENGRDLKISLLGIDEGFYNYMAQLIVQGGRDTGPFGTPAATVRGNIMKITNGDKPSQNINKDRNFALGYFAVCQSYSHTLLIQKQ